MQIQILKCRIMPNATSIACLDVKYYDLVLKCHLVYYPETREISIRLPQCWASSFKKKTACFWPDRLVSDEFQKIVIDRVFEAYDLNLQRVEQLYASFTKKIA